MKIKLNEIRRAKFISLSGIPPRCRIDFTYSLKVDNDDSIIFYSEESAKEYIKYLQEIKNNYEKTIIEEEI